jgi:hypothetical protein
MLNIIKVFIAAGMIVLASVVAKRSAFFGALIIAMPMGSVLSLLFLYFDTKDSARTIEFAKEIFFMIPVSLIFFVPFLLANRTGWTFG